MSKIKQTDSNLRYADCRWPAGRVWWYAWSREKAGQTDSRSVRKRVNWLSRPNPCRGHHFRYLPKSRDPSRCELRRPQKRVYWTLRWFESLWVERDLALRRWVKTLGIRWGRWFLEPLRIVLSYRWQVSRNGNCECVNTQFKGSRISSLRFKPVRRVRNVIQGSERPPCQACNDYG